MEKIKKIDIVLDPDGYEAVYKDGEFADSSYTVYPIELIEICGAGPVLLAHHVIEFCHDSWPASLANALRIPVEKDE